MHLQNFNLHLIFLDNIDFRDLAIEVYRDIATGKKLSEKVAENSIKAGQGRSADKTGDDAFVVCKWLSYKRRSWLFKDTHRDKAPSNKTSALRKSTNIGVWVVGTSNQLFVRGS